MNEKSIEIVQIFNIQKCWEILRKQVEYLEELLIIWNALSCSNRNQQLDISYN